MGHEREAVECHHSQPFLRLQHRQGSTETPKRGWVSGMSVGMMSCPTSPPWHGLGVRLCGEVGAEVLPAKQSADTTEMRAGLCLLRSVSDHSPSSFSWAWGCWYQPVPETIVQVRAVRRGLKAARSKLPCYLQTKPHLSQDYPELPCASVVEEDRSW